MASRSTRKTWETAFLLSASMSSSYTETFDKAQQILKDLGAENIQLGDEAEKAGKQQENAIMLAAAAITETGLIELLDKVKAAYIDIVETTMEFEYTMSAVKALSGSTASELEELEDKARTLGETTVYTANQSASAMTYMAQAGWDTIEMLEGMDGVISLAAASGTDLAEASSITADTLAGFGMAADETARLSDVLAQTSANTNTNVSLMGETFANSAAIAGALGFQIEDVSVMLGLMANAGVKGSKAGTTLRNIFNGLAKDVTLTAEAFGEVDFSMFDENGNAKGLVEVVRELREYFSQMTEQEKYLNASNIAGLRGYNGLLAILNATDDQFEELYANIEDCYGAAERMAKIRLDNLKGDVTLLNSAVESLKITIGDELNPENRILVEDLTSITQWANEFMQAHPGVIQAISLITTAVIGATTALTGYVAVTKVYLALEVVKKLLNAKARIIMAIGAIIASIGALIVKGRAARKELSKMFDEQKELAEQYQAYAEAYKETAKAWAETIETISAEKENILSLTNRLDELVGVQDKTIAQKQEILSIVELLNEAVPELALAYDEEADKLNLTAEAIRARAEAELYAEEIAAKEEQLKERLKRSKALASEVKGADELYNQTKETYETTLSTEANRVLETYNDVQSYEDAVYYVRNNVKVKAAREAYQEAQEALMELYATQATNERFIAGYSEEIAEYYAGQQQQAAEKAGQEEIKEAEQAAGTTVKDAEDMMDDFIRYGSVQSTDAESEAEGQQEIMDAEVPDGAVMAAAENPVVIESTININGNVTEETLPEVEQIVNEAAEKVIERLERTSRSRVRAAYN